jgi:hypothetical protein
MNFMSNPSNQTQLTGSFASQANQNINIPSTSVDAWSDQGNYSSDVDALPVAFPAGYIPNVHIPGDTQEYYQGKGAVENNDNIAEGGAPDIAEGGYGRSAGTRIVQMQSHVFRVENYVGARVPLTGFSGRLDILGNATVAAFNPGDNLQREASFVVKGAGDVEVVVTTIDGDTIKHIIPCNGSHEIDLQKTESTISTIQFTELDGADVKVIWNTVSHNDKTI